MANEKSNNALRIFLLLFFLKKGGYSLTGKTTNLHFVILGSIPNISIKYTNLNLTKKVVNSFKSKAREAQPGRAEHWRCLGCKFKSYLERI